MSRRKPDTTDDEVATRREANRELGRAKKAIEAARSFYLANAMIAGILLAASFLLDAGVVPMAIFGGLTVAAIVGHGQMYKQPFAWSLMLAVGWTLYIAAYVAMNGFAISLLFGFACLWTAGCWYSVKSTRRVAVLLEEHPDLLIARRMRSKR